MKFTNSCVSLIMILSLVVISASSLHRPFKLFSFFLEGGGGERGVGQPLFKIHLTFALFCNRTLKAMHTLNSHIHRTLEFSCPHFQASLILFLILFEWE